MIESIPGLCISGSSRKPVSNIHVEYVNKIQTNSSSFEPSKLGVEDEDDLTITESTTSRFEKVERLVEKDSLEVEIKKKLREKVRDILIKKYCLDLDESPVKMIQTSPSLSFQPETLPCSVVPGGEPSAIISSSFRKSSAVRSSSPLIVASPDLLSSVPLNQGITTTAPSPSSIQSEPSSSHPNIESNFVHDGSKSDDVSEKQSNPQYSTSFEDGSDQESSEYTPEKEEPGLIGKFIKIRLMKIYLYKKQKIISHFIGEGNSVEKCERSISKSEEEICERIGFLSTIQEVSSVPTSPQVNFKFCNKNIILLFYLAKHI